MGCRAVNDCNACSSGLAPGGGGAQNTICETHNNATTTAAIRTKALRSRRITISLRQNCFYTGQLTEIHERWENVAAISQTSLFIGPVQQKFVHIALSRDKSMRPKRDAALAQPLRELRGRWLENRGAGDNHLEFPLHSAQPRQHSFADLADQLYRKAACFTFGRDAVFGKARGPEFPSQRGRTRAVSNNLYLVVLRVDVLQISVVDALFAELGQQQDGEKSIEVTERGSSISIFQHHALRKTCR